MDVNEFINETPPKAKRSRLYPFREPILLLNGKDYSNNQIREWLQLNGVEVSQESVRKFIKKQKNTYNSVLAKNRNVPPAQAPIIETMAAPNEELLNNQTGEEPDNIRTIFDPSDLRALLHKKVDLAALSQLGKELNRKRKKKDENSRN